MLLEWLSEKGPHAPKHHGWAHPVTVCLIHYSVVTFVTILTHDWLVHLQRWYSYPVADGDGNNEDEFRTSSTSTAYCRTERQQRTAIWLACYSVWLLMWRLVVHQPRVYRNTVWYEYCWLCNVTLTVGGVVGLWTGRPIVAAAYCAAVGIDQLLWYVDLTVYMCTGHFPIGVAKYVFWPGSSTWATRVTCTHHLWTIPVTLYATQGMHWLALPCSFVYMSVNVVLSRWMIPIEVEQRRACRAAQSSPCSTEKVTTTTKKKYLNVNLSHAVWKDIQIPILQIHVDNPPVLVYLFRLLWRWQSLNAIVFVVLYSICQQIFGTATTTTAPVFC